ncbi:MaoC family dehydratase [Acidipropionibacterium timonense]|uniref:MaoC family dehydratase n=1 Tax=Acidipropionibacterium timonense TaxID=2161818 RepID=UPI0010308CBA|nr:MaoC family dehydratase [Acidipropionibacterium timonense]
MMMTQGQTFGPVRVPVDRSTIVRYAGASTDFNPIHWSDRAARAAGMDGVIAHGMWTMGAALGVVVDWVGDPGRVRSQKARFTRPVLVPDDEEGTAIEVSGTVRAADEHTATILVDVTHDGVAVLGRVEVVVSQEQS